MQILHDSKVILLDHHHPYQQRHPLFHAHWLQLHHQHLKFGLLDHPVLKIGIRSKMVKMVKNGQIWSKMVKNDQKWSKMVKNEHFWKKKFEKNFFFQIDSECFKTYFKPKKLISKNFPFEIFSLLQQTLEITREWRGARKKWARASTPSTVDLDTWKSL